MLVISGGAANMPDGCLEDDDDDEDLVNSILNEEAEYIWDHARGVCFARNFLFQVCLLQFTSCQACVFFSRKKNRSNSGGCLWGSTAGYVIQGHVCDICRNVDSSQFWAKMKSFGKLMQPGGIYFLYYAGYGVEIQGSFYFIPKGAEDETGCISIGEVMAHFDKVAAVGCEVIFCINACRTKLSSTIPDPGPLDNEYGRENRYHILFSTSAGEEVPLGENVVFRNAVANMISAFTNDNSSHVLNQILDTIHQRDEQQNPRLLSGGFRDKSTWASSASSFSFATPANGVDRLQGIWAKKVAMLGLDLDSLIGDCFPWAWKV